MDGTILEKRLKLEEKLAQLNEIAQKVDGMPTFTSNDRAFLADLPGYPAVDGKKVLTATTESGETTLSYEEQESGVVNYSTNEQATGQKWIDGKEIYQKTIPVTLPNDSSGVLCNVNANIDYIIDIHLVGFHVTDFYVANSSYLSTSVWYRNTDDSIQIATVPEWMQGDSGYLTLKYTKASVSKRSRKS